MRGFERRNDNRKTRTDKIVFIPPDRTVVEREILRVFPIVHNFEHGQELRRLAEPSCFR